MRIFRALNLTLSSHFSKINEVPMLFDFLNQEQNKTEPTYMNEGIKYYIHTYGCQMNQSDSQIVSTVLSNNGYQKAQTAEEAQILLLNTCAVREHAETKVLTKLQQLKNQNQIVCVLGCMAERLKQKLWDNGADIVVGPDNYRSLPELLRKKGKQAEVSLSWDETYHDLLPQQDANSVTAYLSIMRGCNNMCSFCIVPFTRGRERSRSPTSILAELDSLTGQQLKEVTLLGQNVNSYFYEDNKFHSSHKNTEGFSELYKLRQGNGIRFANLLEMVAIAAPQTRIRFTSPHPKDFPDEVLDVIAKYPNICKRQFPTIYIISIHLPFQSGSNSVLARMRRNYTKEAYLQLIQKAREKMPGLSFSTDIITGFCGESEEEFNDTLKVIEEVKFEQAFMFAFSMREKTHAHRSLKDDVAEEVKQERLRRVIQVVHRQQLEKNLQEVGKRHLVLIDCVGKKENQLKGRSDTNKSVIIDNSCGLQLGQFVEVVIEKASLKSLFGRVVRQSSIGEFGQ